MADPELPVNQGILEVTLDDRKVAMLEDLNNPLSMVDKVYLLWWNWADFHIQILSPHFDFIKPSRIIEPEAIPGTNEYEFVYPIHDCGSKLSTSKSQDMFSVGMSMCKMYFTIEKMIYILIERLKDSGVDNETEVQVAFAGHELAQRKAFESVINLSYNLVVTNFDPGIWGERYLQNVKRLADRGYGYPPEAPRETFKQSFSGASSATKKS